MKGEHVRSSAVVVTFALASALMFSGRAAAQCGPPACLLSWVQSVQHPSLVGDGSVGAAYGVTVSPDGKTVYVVPVSGDRIVAFSRTPTTGELTYLEQHDDGVGGVDGLDGAFQVRVSPDNKNVYVASQDDSAVAVFTRNTATGALTFLEVHEDGQGGVDGLDEAYSVAITLDGKNVYVAGEGDSALAVFDRNPADGSLTFHEVHTDGQGGVDGLAAAFSVEVTSDGKQVVGAGQGDNALAVFDRNLTTGHLTFREVLRDGQNGVDGLGGATFVALSPGGKNAYVAATSESAIGVFSRNDTTGQVAFQEVEQDGVGGVPYPTLGSIRAVTVSADGACVFSTSFFLNTLAVFSRNTATGALTYVESQNQVNLAGPVEVAVSPYYRNVYVAGQLGQGQVTVFARPIVYPE